MARIVGTRRPAKTEADHERRALLFEIVRTLRTTFGEPEWGVLVKTDQNDKIPADILVWRPTMEHFDVLTGAGEPLWHAHGPVTNFRWLWMHVPSSIDPDADPDPDPDPDPPPPPPPPDPELAVLRRQLAETVVALRHLESAVVALAGRVAHAEQLAARPFPCSTGTIAGVLRVRVCPEPAPPVTPEP